MAIEFTHRARRDIDDIVAYIAADSPAAATKWRKSLHAQLQVLATMPHSCPFAFENGYRAIEIRNLIHGNYRALYTVEGDTVLILSVRHCARRFMTSEELDRIE